MDQVHARNVIIGSGATGAAAAYHLARRGEPVLLLEQFTIGHDRGSSHGAARITRHSYADPQYARLMPDAFRAWKTLEAEAGENLYLRTGGISFCPPSLDYAARVAASLAAIDVPHRRMSGRQLNRCFSAFQLPDETDVVFEPDAGMLSAARAIAAEIALARSFGGERTQVIENCAVRRIDLEADLPTVVTDAHQIVAEHLIVSAGAWTRELLPELPFTLRATRQQVLYFRPKDPVGFVPGRFPVFIAKGAGELNDYYGMPEFLGLGVKVARHGGPDVDPNIVDRTIDADYQAIVREFLRGHIPTLAEAPISLSEICIYTVAPDDHFRIGPLANRPEILVASPCSGHGFKFSCLIGGILADLATLGQSDVGVDSWRV